MPAWSLSGPILLALTAPAAGDRGALVPKAKAPARVVDVPRRDAYRIPAARQAFAPIDTQPSLIVPQHVEAYRDRRFDRSLASVLPAIRDPQADSVRTQLRDRLARRGGALDARVEWRLTGDGSDLGIGGGLARVVETLLHD